jgi:hypothetical protein
VMGYTKIIGTPVITGLYPAILWRRYSGWSTFPTAARAG